AIGNGTACDGENFGETVGGRLGIDDSPANDPITTLGVPVGVTPALSEFIRSAANWPEATDAMHAIHPRNRAIVATRRRRNDNDTGADSANGGRESAIHKSNARAATAARANSQGHKSLRIYDCFNHERDARLSRANACECVQMR